MRSNVMGGTTIRRYRIPVLVFLIVAAIGATGTWYARKAALAATETRFQAAASEAANRVRLRLEQHVALLAATRSLFISNDGAVTRTGFRTFIDGLDIEERHAGIQGIGFARLIPAEEDAEAAAAAEIRAQYRIVREIWPETGHADRAAIVLLEPDDARNRAALGYDMMSEETRRAAMEAAIATRSPRASGAVELVQEITDDKQAGFLIYLPLTLSGRDDVAGFVYAPFRAEDFFTAALGAGQALPLVVEAADVTDGGEAGLFRSPDFAAAGPAAERIVDVAGRDWRLRLMPTAGFARSGRESMALLIGFVTLLLAVALALLTRSLQHSAETSRALKALADKTVADKEMLLREMAHRIKNSIGRTLAIARRTAESAEDLDGFIESFSGRMNAMAAAQDMVSTGGGAELGELLRRELLQVFGEDGADGRRAGPDVPLDDRGARAFGLVFHELATNALKYGGAARDINVTWGFEGERAGRRLSLTWSETGARDVPCAAPSRTGFGTRIIDMSVQGELGGRIERRFAPEGLTVEIEVPGDKLVRV